MPQKTKHTPMMEQYFSIKADYPDCLLFYRLGDFYELFYEDALEAARILEITLTSRNKNAEDPIPMCGVPHHAAKDYLKTLIHHGKKVAICEQMEDPKLTKGMVKRAVVQVLTPGTYLYDQDRDVNHYLVSLVGTGPYGLAYTDIATGEFRGTILADFDQVRNELASLNALEILYSQNQTDPQLEAYCNQEQIVLTPTAFSMEGQDLVQGAGQQLIAYLEKTQMRQLSHLKPLETYQAEFFLSMSADSKRNLELLATLRQGGKKGSLLGYLDKSQTAMGSRLLKQWVEKPLILDQAIQNRLDRVEDLMDHFFHAEDLRQALRGVYDLERIVSKVSFGTANARDLLHLLDTLERIPYFYSILDSLSPGVWQELLENLGALPDLVSLLKQALDPDAPISLTEGQLIRPGYNAQLDQYRDILTHGKEWIAQLQAQERERTGIKSLKIAYNKVFGYYIEITKANLANLDASRYERKQTLSNAERFVTPELKIQEAKILEAEEKSSLLEYQLFVEIRDRVKSYTRPLQALALALAQVDVLQAFAKVAQEGGLVRPQVSSQIRDLDIDQGRHPVVEEAMGSTHYVPNSLRMGEEDKILLITGPNMSGKSTYMRQVAITIIMAQMGSFVPAKSAQLPIFTKIFTRIGATDDLAAGQSTFMVEMMETNLALRQADARSLILFDEIGRGTATYDGMALAHAILTYLHDKLQAKVLFSTHYHELTSLSQTYPALRNVHVGAIEQEGKVVFLHRIMEGPADKSYGIHVAKLAGLPDSLLEQAQVLLTQLEAQGPDRKSLPQPDRARESFPSATEQKILDQVKGLDWTNMSPLQVMEQVARWQDQLKE